MGIIETVRRGFSIANKNFALIMILFVFNLIGSLIRIPMTQGLPTVQVPFPLILISVLLGLAGVLIFGGVLASLKDYIKTQKTEMSNFIGYGSKFYLRVLSVWLLIALILILLSLIVAFAISMAVAVRNAVGTVIFTTLALIISGVGIYIFILLFMSPYILIADDIGPLVAIKKSINFVRNALVKVIGLLLVLMLISMGVGFLVGLIAGVVTFALRGGLGGQIILALVGSAFNSYINVLLPACLLLVYLTSKPKEAVVS